MGTQAVCGDEARAGRGGWRRVRTNRVAACRAPALVSVPSCRPLGAGLRGSTARRAGGRRAAPTAEAQTGPPRGAAPWAHTRPRAWAWRHHPPSPRVPVTRAQRDTSSLPAPCRAGVAARPSCPRGGALWGRPGHGWRAEAWRWNPRHAVEGGHRARGPRLVKGPERGRCAGHHGARRQKGLRSGQVDSLTARIREGGAAAADHGQERLGRARLAGLGSHHGPRIPHHEDSPSCQSGRMVASMLTQSQCL